MASTFPSPSPASAAAPLPPLPDLSSNPGMGSSGSEMPENPLASILSGIAPVKMAVDSIMSACASVVKSGAVPGAEQICGQIAALAASLLPMAAQSAFQPAGAGGPMPGMGAGGSSMSPMPPSPGGPTPMGM